MGYVLLTFLPSNSSYLIGGIRANKDIKIAMAVFSMRIVDADFYMSKPQDMLDHTYSDFSRSTTPNVPVIRIFGATPVGQKTCLHIHKVYPYFYVQMDKSEINYDTLLSFSKELDFALHSALGKAVSSPTNYVMKIEAVKKVPYYGYHEGQKDFLKVYYYSPYLTSRIAEILLSGSIMNRVFQPYETHIPYLLQFLIDFNLYGMNMINLSSVKFRRSKVIDESLSSPSCCGSSLNAGSDESLPLSVELSSTCFTKWDKESLCGCEILPGNVRCQSTCELEVDCNGDDILNRTAIRASIGSNPGLDAIWEDEKQRRRMRNESSQITLRKSQDRPGLIILDSERMHLDTIITALEKRLREGELVSPSQSTPFTPELLKDDTTGVFSSSPGSSIEDSQIHDSALVDILTDLIDGDDDELSDSDSANYDLDHPTGEDKVRDTEDDEESMLMSQRVFDDVDANGDANEPTENSNSDDEGVHWSSSFAFDIPQLDGTADFDSTYVTECPRPVHIRWNIGNGRKKELLTLVNNIRNNKNRMENTSCEVFNPISRNNTMKAKGLQRIPQLDGSADESNENITVSPSLRRRALRRGKRKTTRKSSLNFMLHDKNCLDERSNVSQPDSVSQRSNICDESVTGRVHALPASSQTTSFMSDLSYPSTQCEVANAKLAKKSRLSVEMEPVDSLRVGEASFESQIGIQLARDPPTNNSCFDSLYHMGRLSPPEVNLNLVSLPSPLSPTLRHTISKGSGQTSGVAVSVKRSTHSDFSSLPSKEICNLPELKPLNETEIYNKQGSYWKGLHKPQREAFDVSTFPHERTCFPRVYNVAEKASFVYDKRPPLRQHVISGAYRLGLSEATHKKAFYGDRKDAPEKSMRIGTKVLKVSSRAAGDLDKFATNSVVCGKYKEFVDRAFPSFILGEESVADRSEALILKRETAMFGNSTVSLTPAKNPPSLSTVVNWLRAADPHQDKKSAPDNKVECLRDRKNVEEEEVKEKRDSLQTCNVTQNTSNSEVQKRDATPVVHRRFSFTHRRPRSLKITGSTPRITKKALTTPAQKASAGSPSFLVSPPLFFSPEKDFHEFKPPPMTSPFASTPIQERSPTGVLSPAGLTKFSFMESEVKRISSHLNFKDSLTHRKSANVAHDLRRQIYQGVACGEMKRSISDTSQIEGPSPNNTFNFKITQLNFQDAKALHVVQHLTKMSLEVHVHTRRNLLPDPEVDPIIACFYCILNDGNEGNMVAGVLVVDRESCKLGTADAENSVCSINLPSSSKTDLSSGGGTTALFALKGRTLLDRCGVTDRYQIEYFKDEESLLHGLGKLVREKDPDILMGYEVEMSSLGYLTERSSHLSIDLCLLLSRIPDDKRAEKAKEDSDGLELKYLCGVDIKIPGRIILNVWRIMRHEVTLNNYSFENVAYHVLHERFPRYSHRVLTDWWNHRTSLVRWRTVEYFIRRSQANVLLLERVDFINRTSELARLFGITFYSVISRGSQFRVESMMLRIAKPMGYIPVSPSVQQRAQMAAPECIPLVMEPESRFYVDPVLVLDFQSLYPSIIIAYNYCFSTCLGNVRHFHQSGSFPYGALSHEISVSTLKRLHGSLHVSPNGVAFVKPHVRRGILPRMLEDILRTRVMVKNAMKKNKDDKILHRMLDARQLGLKLIANVTFGYTSANFSGRMPCIEIGDTIVRKARETLERAIELVNTNKEWHARVVYGDTDSMFVLLRGASKERAFAVAKEIVEAVSKTNPKPIKLKFEKVYYPCVLQTKKRYVGYMYETLEQKEPIFDAKGIETVRRDNCAAVAKILEKSLRTLFETKNVSLVKTFVQRQLLKIMEGRVSLQDFTFAKEYRGMNNYKPGACVPALELARRRLVRDKRSEPRIGERVPYVIVYGTPGLPLIQLVRPPEELFKDASLRLNGMYYITKQILPPLDRAFALMGVDVGLWFKELPRISRGIGATSTSDDTRKGTISQYFTSMNCLICKELTRDPLCQGCSSDPQISAVTLASQLKKTEKRFAQLTEICNNCAGFQDRDFFCVSLDCPVLYKLLRVQMERRKDSKIRDVLATMT